MTIRDELLKSALNVIVVPEKKTITKMGHSNGGGAVYETILNPPQVLEPGWYEVGESKIIPLSWIKRKWRSFLLYFLFEGYMKNGTFNFPKYMWWIKT